VLLDPDVAAAFPDAKAVNAALRSLIEEKQTPLGMSGVSSVSGPPQLGQGSGGCWVVISGAGFNLLVVAESRCLAFSSSGRGAGLSRS
jgi:hypothetical protein